MPDRPNVLWIIAEDMCPELGCYGTDLVDTPNIDSLAEEGVRFENAFATSPTCSPARSALFTGMYATSIDAQHQAKSSNDPAPADPLSEDVRPVSDWLRDAGYVAANLSEFPEGMNSAGVSGKLHWNFTYESEAFDTDDWAEMVDGEPFFGQIAFKEAHRGPYWDDAHERIADPVDPDDVTVPPYYPDHPAVREDWAQYLNTVMALDGKVGSVLEQLETEGIREDTVVVFTADHGRPFLRDKQQLFDGGLHVPLIVSWPENYPGPDGYEAGTADDRLVSTIDVTAETLAAGGVDVPETMQGRRLFGPNAGDGREYVFATVDRMAEIPGRARLVRSHRYSYIRTFTHHQPYFRMNRYCLATRTIPWVLLSLEEAGDLPGHLEKYLAASTPEEELFDLRGDPHQLEDVAGDPEHAEDLERMRRLLDEWIVETNDKGRFPEGPGAVEYYEERKAEAFDETIQERKAEWGIEQSKPEWGI